MGKKMYLTGFADEAAKDIEGQIRATKELGWENIEARNIARTNIHDLSDMEFDVVYGKIEDAGIKINCFGSTIANWGKSVLDSVDPSFDEVRRAIPRMKRLGTELIRVMSYSILEDRKPDDQMEEERFRRLREITKMFLDEGIQPVHENCMNYGGMGWTFTQKILENVPGLKLVFDTGNPVNTADLTKPEPYPMQSSWEFYSRIKEHVSYVHIKDGNTPSPTPENPNPKVRFCYPGEGNGDVRRIVKDLIESGYDGGISIEPHMKAVFHDPSIESNEQAKYAVYIEYGRRMEKIIEDIIK